MLFRFQPFTWSFAVSNMIFQTDLVLSRFDVFLAEVEVASPQWEQFSYKIQQNIGSPFGGIRTKIFGTVPLYLPGKKDSGETFVFNANVTVGFPVLQHDVVPW